MSLFGLFSSDSTSSTRKENSSRSNVLTASGGNSKINSTAIGGVRVDGGNPNINIKTTDFGAIQAGEKIALKAIDQNRGAFSDALNVVNGALDFSQQSVKKGFDLVNKNTIGAVSSGLNKVLILAGIAVAGFVAVQYLKGK